MAGLPCLGPMLALAGALCSGDDWPTYRGDTGRSGAVAEGPGAPLHLAWTSTLLPPPAPAWPPPARGSLWQRLDHLEARVTDDVALHPVIAGDRVLLASSGDDRVVCLDGADGSLLWQHRVNAPVRFAPAVAGEVVYFGGDDGCVTAVALDTGERRWRTRVGPEGDWIVANGRLASPWPVRTGVLVDAGVVYACAGLFPGQGVYAVALSVANGDVLWRQELNRSPQGYLLASSTTLFVPAGRASPFALSRDDGRFLRDVAGPGGSYAVLAGPTLLSGPGNDGTLQGTDVNSGSRLVHYQGKHLAVTDDHSYLLTGQRLARLDRTRYLRLAGERRAREQALGQAQDDRARQQLEKEVRRLEAELAECLEWEVDTTHDGALVLAGDTLYSGGADGIVAHRARDGSLLWRTKTGGRVVGLAVTAQLLLATTDTGEVLAYRSGRGRPGSTGDPSSATAHDTAGQRDAADEDPATILAAVIDTAMAEAVIEDLDSRRGHVLVVGARRSELVDTLVRNSAASVVVVDTDADRLTRLRDHLISRRVYGRRASTRLLTGPRLPFADHLFNAVVIEADPAEGPDTGGRIAFSDTELERVTVPGRGHRYHLDATSGEVLRTRHPPLEGAGGWVHTYGDLANTASSGDRRVGAELALQWFGGPGPGRLIDRHLRGPPPLAVNGRLFIVGENCLIAVDAYNGSELWEAALPDSQRYATPYDAGYITARDDAVFAAVDNEVRVLEPSDGSTSRTLKLPRRVRAGHHFGYVGVDREHLYCTFMLPTASRTEPSRAQVAQDYHSRSPVVTGRGVFRMTDAGELDWLYREGAVLHPTVTVANGHVFFVESRNREAREDDVGRLPLEVLLAADAYLMALDAGSGKVTWERELDLRHATNILYLQAAGERLVLTSCQDAENSDAHYRVAVMDAADGGDVWTREHPNGKPGQLGHGEQVHHPVVLGPWLIAEPVIYELATGDRVNPVSSAEPWTLTRPGHSCGTLTGCGQLLFFRANQPTMLDLSPDAGTRFQKLSPNRAGCWINILPACGLVLIPEASASCVCQYPLQTSMAFRPLDAEGR